MFLVENIITTGPNGAGQTSAMYNYYSDTRNWLTQFYLHGNHTNKNVSHDLLEIHQTDILNENIDPKNSGIIVTANDPNTKNKQIDQIDELILKNINDFTK